MRCRFLKPFRGWQAGDEPDLPASVVEAWAAAGTVETIDGAAAPAASETAMLAPGERAVIPPGRARRPGRE